MQRMLCWVLLCKLGLEIRRLGTICTLFRKDAKIESLQNEYRISGTDRQNCLVSKKLAESSSIILPNTLCSQTFARRENGEKTPFAKMNTSYKIITLSEMNQAKISKLRKWAKTQKYLKIHEVGGYN